MFERRSTLSRVEELCSAEKQRMRGFQFICCNRTRRARYSDRCIDVEYNVWIRQAPDRVSDRQSPGTVQHLSATRLPSNGNILNSGGPQQVQDQGMSKLCSLAVSLSICAECIRYRQPSLEATKSESPLADQILVRPRGDTGLERKGNTRISRQRITEEERGMGRTGRSEPQDGY